LAAADQQTFDLVVSDIGLPDGDGYQLMASLRQQHGLAGIAISGFGFTEDIARSSKAGFFAHLTKPISVPVIEQTIARLRRDIAQRFQEGQVPARFLPSDYPAITYDPGERNARTSVAASGIHRSRTVALAARGKPVRLRSAPSGSVASAAMGEIWR
jgi:DNA-binding response OmpR family regulator